eukprot:3185348-Alexandrium_andersonii.AAC.1
MSASLVGSEMCIRDRRCGALRGAVRCCAVRCRAVPCGGTAWRCMVLHGACLLYTSDAADDM